jgi:hypothetical protein
MQNAHDPDAGIRHHVEYGMALMLKPEIARPNLVDGPAKVRKF